MSEFLLFRDLLKKYVSQPLQKHPMRLLAEMASNTVPQAPYPVSQQRHLLVLVM